MRLNIGLDQPAFILDLGCGSGLSGECLEENGHYWVGVDISPAMLSVAQEREVEGDLILGDLVNNCNSSEFHQPLIFLTEELLFLRARVCHFELELLMELLA